MRLRRGLPLANQMQRRTGKILTGLLRWNVLYMMTL
jgi:hypothetical protein